MLGDTAGMNCIICSGFLDKVSELMILLILGVKYMFALKLTAKTIKYDWSQQEM